VDDFFFQLRRRRFLANRIAEAGRTRKAQPSFSKRRAPDAAAPDGTPRRGRFRRAAGRHEDMTRRFDAAPDGTTT
jgi:hypothetical protein